MINCATLLVMAMERECDQNKQYLYRLFFHMTVIIGMHHLLKPPTLELENGLRIDELGKGNKIDLISQYPVYSAGRST